MAFKLGMAVDINGIYTRAHFDDLDFEHFCKVRPSCFSLGLFFEVSVTLYLSLV